MAARYVMGFHIKSMHRNGWPPERSETNRMAAGVPARRASAGLPTAASADTGRRAIGSLLHWCIRVGQLVDALTLHVFDAVGGSQRR